MKFKKYFRDLKPKQSFSKGLFRTKKKSNFGLKKDPKIMIFSPRNFKYREFGNFGSLQFNEKSNNYLPKFAKN